MAGTARILTAFALVALLAAPAAAESKRGHVPDKDYGQPGTRYPGDKAYAFGNARTSGPEQGAYIEKCSWSIGGNLYFLPFDIKQTCTRYTLDNTQQQ